MSYSFQFLQILLLSRVTNIIVSWNSTRLQHFSIWKLAFDRFLTIKKNIYQTYQILVTFSRFLCPLRVEFRVFNDGALSSFVPGLYHGTKLQQFHLMPLETF